MRYVIVDLEATCWNDRNWRDKMETIEIGAVMLESVHGPVIDEFATFIKPVVEMELSDFCTELTSIKQSQVDKAPYFGAAFHDFMAWIGDEPFAFCSWGNYDLVQLQRDCERHNIEFPQSLMNHVNIKTEFSRVFDVKRCGMEKALQVLSIPLEGTHHRGIDDARNIAKIAMEVLPRVML